MASLLADHWTWLVLLGILSGLLSGSLGVGSGALLVPLLVVFFEIPQKSAQGMSLAVMVPIALIGAVRYKLNPDIPVDYILVSLIITGGVAGVLIGTNLAHMLPAVTLRRLFALFLMLMALRMFTAAPADAGTEAATHPGSESGKVINQETVTEDSHHDERIGQ